MSGLAWGVARFTPVVWLYFDCLRFTVNVYYFGGWLLIVSWLLVCFICVLLRVCGLVAWLWWVCVIVVDGFRHVRGLLGCLLFGWFVVVLVCARLLVFVFLIAVGVCV